MPCASSSPVAALAEAGFAAVAAAGADDGGAKGGADASGVEVAGGWPSAGDEAAFTGRGAGAAGRDGSAAAEAASASVGTLPS